MTSPTALDALKLVLREQVGPALRAHGYKGSAPTWVLTNAEGDRAIVNVQSSDTSSRSQVLCTVNTSVIPLAWWRWINHNLSKSEARAPKESDGLWRQRVDARQQCTASRPAWWSITDVASARRAAADLIDQLEHGVVANLHRLIQPGVMLQAARCGRLGHPTYDNRGVLAVLLTDHGHSDELASLLDELETLEDARLRSAFWPMAQWCRETLKCS